MNIEISSRQLEILSEILQEAPGVLEEAVARLHLGSLSSGDIEIICNAINAEFLMKGIYPDYSPNDYGNELELLLDAINRPRLSGD